MTRHRLFAAAAVSLLAQGAQADPVGTVIFSQSGVQIVNASGAARPARQGDRLEAGDRLVTPPDAIGQLRLADGSLVGVRPGSELRIDGLTSQDADHARQAMSLVRGAVRVIGSELMDAQKPSAISLRAGAATLQFSGADLESAVVRPDAPRTPGAIEPGSYSRLLAGDGTIRSGTAAEPLAMRQVSFVSAANPAAVVLGASSFLFTAVPKGGSPGPSAGLAVPEAPLAKSVSSLTSTLTVPALPGAASLVDKPVPGAQDLALKQVLMPSEMFLAPMTPPLAKAPEVKTPSPLNLPLVLPPVNILTTTTLVKPKVSCIVQTVGQKKVCI